MIYVFLADGFEEMEAITPVDVLRRCELEVKTVSVGGGLVRRGSHGIEVAADITEEEVLSGLDETLEMVVLPGGMPGTLNLERSSAVQRAIDYAYKEGRLIGAICAAPSILGHKGMLKGKKAVCFEGFESQLEGAEVLKAPVCVDGKIITGRGAGVSLEFALKLAEELCSKERSELLRAAMQCIVS